MSSIQKSQAVPYSQQQMYGLVNDIENYREFVPWCAESKIIKQTPDEVRATLAFASSGFKKSFTTLNRLQPHKMIEIRLVDGPFHHLEGFWQFEALEAGGSRVSLTLDFEFSNALVSLMFGPVFNQVANSLVDAFCKRADALYQKDLP